MFVLGGGNHYHQLLRHSSENVILRGGRDWEGLGGGGRDWEGGTGREDWEGGRD